MKNTPYLLIQLDNHYYHREDKKEKKNKLTVMNKPKYPYKNRTKRRRKKETLGCNI